MQLYSVWALNRTSIFEFRPRIQSLATVSYRNRGGRNSMGIIKERQLGGSGSVSHRNGWDERWLLCTLPHAQGAEQPKKKRLTSFVVRFAHDLQHVRFGRTDPDLHERVCAGSRARCLLRSQRRLKAPTSIVARARSEISNRRFIRRPTRC